MSVTQQFVTKNISDLANATTPLSGTELFAIEQGGVARKLAMDVLQALVESVDWSDISGKPTFATVATSGSYNDLSNKPTMVTSVNGNTGAVTGLQTTSNLVTSVSSASTNTQYPSAKLLYDTVGNIETLLASI